MNKFSFLVVIEFREVGEVDKLNFGSDFGEEYLKIFDVVVIRILF